jgi:hypothetical protein
MPAEGAERVDTAKGAHSSPISNTPKGAHTTLNNDTCLSSNTSLDGHTEHEPD